MFHLVNCLLLCYGPYYIVYKSTSLAEERSLPAIFSVIFIYIAVQAGKLFIVATFLPSIDTNNADNNVFLHQLIHHIF